MELDQLIFKHISNYFKRRKKNQAYDAPSRVNLEDIVAKLYIMASALTGEAIDIMASEREGGWKNKVFFLPESIALFSTTQYNINLYVFRVFYLSVQRELNLNWRQGETRTVAESQKNALDNSQKVLEVLFDTYPALREIHAELLASWPIDTVESTQNTQDLTWLYGRWMQSDLEFDRSRQLEHINQKSQSVQESEKITTEIEAKQADEIEVVQVDRKAQEDYVLTHNFEKVETIDEHSDVWRDFDGDDNLDQESDALDEFNLSKVVRVDNPVHSVYKAKFVSNASIAESAVMADVGFHHLYPEWDYKRRKYHNAYCKLYHKKLLKTDGEYYTQTISHNRSVLLKLQKIFARMNNDRKVVRRLSNGALIDIDAVTDMYADLKAGQTPDERIYMSRRKKRKELSILYLLDLSLSSDGYSKGNRIIDVEKQVSILFGEVLDENMVDFQIDGFYSKTRNNSSYITLKSFDESWNTAKLKIGAIQPAGYTRIGPALRHATTLINKRSMRKKWIILLSDGKPNDYDRYEGKYGIMDIKQALREMNTHGISNFALAIEEQAKYYLPQMFGNNHYNILSSPIQMIDSLAKLYKRIEKGY